MASDINICVKANWLRAVCSALPAWFRFAQCFRRYKDQKDTVHLVNAGKYSSTLIVVIFSFLNVYFNLHFAYSEVGSKGKKLSYIQNKFTIVFVSKRRNNYLT